jgi:type II secretion system protein I
MHFHFHHRRRPGLSLLEVLVAMAIFLFSVIAIAHVIGQAGDRAIDVQRQSQAIQICHAKMAEVIAGAIPMSSQSDTPLEEDPDWHWSLDAQQGSVAGLWNVNIKVSRQGPNKIETSLSQLVLDPSLRGNNMQPILTPDMPSSSSDNSSSPSSTQGGNTPTGGAPGNLPTNQGKSPTTPAGSSTTPKPSTPSTPAPAPSSPTPKPTTPSTPAPTAPASTPKPPSTPSSSPTPKPPTRGGS